MIFAKPVQNTIRTYTEIPETSAPGCTTEKHPPVPSSGKSNTLFATMHDAVQRKHVAIEREREVLQHQSLQHTCSGRETLWATENTTFTTENRELLQKRPRKRDRRHSVELHETLNPLVYKNLHSARSWTQLLAQMPSQTSLETRDRGVNRLARH